MDGLLRAVCRPVLLSVVAHALTAKPLAGRYAAYVEQSGGPADVRPTAEPATRSRLGQRHPAAAGDRADDPEGDTSAETLGAGT